MRKTHTAASVLSLTGLVALAQPYETATVISATPIVTQVPHTVCTPTVVAVPEPRSGAGAVMGAIAGGVVGNAIGQGAGNAAATAIGIVGGAMLGERLEGQGGLGTHTVQQCTEQWIQVSAYQVEYELNGRRYTTHMNQAPGQTLMIQAAPTIAAPQPPLVYTAPPVYRAPPPIFMAPLGYPYPYGHGFYPPIGISFGIGYHHYRRH